MFTSTHKVKPDGTPRRTHASLLPRCTDRVEPDVLTPHLASLLERFEPHQLNPNDNLADREKHAASMRIVTWNVVSLLSCSSRADEQRLTLYDVGDINDAGRMASRR